MKSGIDRREFLKLAGAGSVVLASTLKGYGGLALAAQDDFHFVQLSDTHWGFNNPAVNPESGTSLKKAVDAVNAMARQPDFIIFTGDLTHTTDDDQVRRKRLGEFKDIVAGLKVKDVRFLPGEHDAGLDNGKAFQEFFGETHYVFEHKGVHFLALDNVSNPGSTIGDAQLQWLAAELAKIDKKAPLVVFTHRPLFDLAPAWDWHTTDGAKALELLKPFANVTVFYGHIHQVNDHEADNVKHHAAMGLMYPLPAPGSVPTKAPIPWSPDQPFKGLGYRGVEESMGKPPVLSEYPLKAG